MLYYDGSLFQFLQLHFDKFLLDSLDHTFWFRLKCTELIRTRGWTSASSGLMHHMHKYIFNNDLVNEFISNLDIKLEKFRQWLNNLRIKKECMAGFYVNLMRFIFRNNVRKIFCMQFSKLTQLGRLISALGSLTILGLAVVHQALVQNDPQFLINCAHLSAICGSLSSGWFFMA